MARNKIIIGVCGGIAVYKTCELVRSLIKQNLPTQIIMTKNATRFISKLTLTELSRCPAYSDEWDEGMLHINIKNQAAVYAVIPATANVIAKMAQGIADDLVTSTYISVQCPVIVVPAMNPNMLAHPATQRNIKRLREDGVMIIDPREDEVLCGDFGRGKLAEVAMVAQEIVKKYQEHLPNG